MRRAFSGLVLPRARAAIACVGVTAAARRSLVSLSPVAYQPQRLSDRPPQDMAPSGEHPHQQQGVPDEEAMRPPEKPTEAPKYHKITVEHPKGISHLQLARPPVNSLNLEVLQELNKWLLWLGSNEETKALVVSSAIPTVFSAGLDLTEMHRPKQERFVSFWESLQEMWLIMNSFPKPIIAAVTGNSPAGGCIMALGCDYRVMARGPAGDSEGKRLYRIGLNETKLGITAPAWTMPAYAYVLGSRQAERMLQLGETPTADEALKLGLVDEVTADEPSCVSAAFRQAEKFLSVPQQSRWMARDMMRREYLQMMATQEDRQYDTEFVTQLISSPEVQQNLDSYMDRLKSRVRK